MERCIRMDMARVLVEVDLTNTLPNKISFQSRDGVPISCLLTTFGSLLDVLLL